MESIPRAPWTEEALDQRNVVEVLHKLIAAEPLAGARVVDATAGNGYDTELLARAVGATGEVMAIDLQSAAVRATKQRIEGDPELAPRVSVFQADHAQLTGLVPPSWRGAVALVMFNLGYLPGGGRELTTRAPSSVAAASAAVELLGEGGLLCMAIYTGHPAGAEEAAALRAWATEQAGPQLTVHMIRDRGESATGRPEILLARRAPPRRAAGSSSG